MQAEKNYYAHPSATIESGVNIGDGTKIWQDCQIRPNVEIGMNCVFGKGVFVDSGVKIGNNVKVQNYVSLFHGVFIEDGVFIGPHVCFTNDLYPRAINKDGSLKNADDWVTVNTFVGKGASIGANSTIRCGVTIDEWALIGAGSVIVKDVPAQALVYGNPAEKHGHVCECGRKMKLAYQESSQTEYHCEHCNVIYTLPIGG